ncbi:DUF4062 domain-containing protein [Glutamicibacter sp.]|uniref:DUF4062 domain-containing protein n=1 Tax=Glutamicibacter sp. TaxID=1931995 RepID=UPI003D6A80B3
MEKRVQVFVSSTFVDLETERQSVVQTLLKMNTFPAGMELFPASDEDKWDLIKGVIDDSDYYCLIVGARYGSEDEKTSLSYTEMEYDYAQETKKPTMVFIHGNPDSVPNGLTDKNQKKSEKLDKFKTKVMGPRNASFFASPHELSANVAVALMDLQRKRPAVGWVRGDAAMSPEIRAELAELRSSVKQSSANSNQPVFPDLEDGEDEYSFGVKFDFTGTDNVGYSASFDCKTTWNEIYSGIAPLLLHETTEARMHDALSRTLRRIGRENAEEYKDVEKVSIVEVNTTDAFSDVLVQLFALRLIERGTAKRTVNDRQKYWQLTEEGEARMMQLRARRRNSTGEVLN